MGNMNMAEGCIYLIPVYVNQSVINKITCICLQQDCSLSEFYIEDTVMKGAQILMT